MIDKVRRLFSGNLSAELKEIREITIQSDDKVDEMIKYIKWLSDQGIYLSLCLRPDKNRGADNE